MAPQDHGQGRYQREAAAAEEEHHPNRDGVLAYEDRIPRKDDEGNFVTIWDGRTTKPHPVTGKEVPDESARTNLFDYTNPKRAEWPEADYIVGNPPFIGASRMRDALGDGYTETLRKAWKGKVPESADFVMYWWQKAAELLAGKKIHRFGFITTNSIHQTFNRRVLEPFLADEKKPAPSRLRHPGSSVGGLGGRSCRAHFHDRGKRWQRRWSVWRK